MGLVIWITSLYLNMMYFSCYIPSHGEAARVLLAGSSSPCSGRVQVYHNSRWGTVCDDGWDLKAAEVVCRELNCGTAHSAPGNARFGRGYGPIWKLVGCSGNETSLTRCQYFGQCDQSDHREDAGVVCSDSLIPRPTMVVRTVVVGCVLLLLLLLLFRLWLIHRRIGTKKTDDTTCVMTANNIVGRRNDENEEVYADAEACHSHDYVNGNVQVDNPGEEEEEEEYDDIDVKEEVNYVTVIG